MAKLTASTDVSLFLAASAKDTAREALNFPIIETSDTGKILSVNATEDGYDHSTVDWNDLTDTADVVPFTVTNGGPNNLGELAWNVDDETLSLALKDNTILRIGEETLYHVENNTVSTITKGSPVMYAGTVGLSGKLRVIPWDGTDGKAFMGLTTSDILGNDDTGYVTHFGKVRGVQTNGANYGQTWTTGNIIYATNGSSNLTNVQPVSGGYVVVAVVIAAHASNGTFFVRPTQVPSFSEIGSISGSTGSTDNAILRADGTGGSTMQSSDIVIDDATTSTQANVAIRNVHSSSSSSIVITPKGNGALIFGPKPDGTSTGGNARGIYAIDLQFEKAEATHVASGVASLVAGGRNKASGAYSSALGYLCEATGVVSHAFGQQSVAAGYASTAIGQEAKATNHGQFSHSAGSYNNRVFQFSQFILRGTSSGLIPSLLRTDGVLGSIQIPEDRYMSFVANIIGVNDDGSIASHHMRKGCMRRIGSTASMFGEVEMIGTDTKTNNTSVSIEVTSNGNVQVFCVGVDAIQMRWVCVLQCTEIDYLPLF